ncbi:hypothetical protein [uncultured Clostridium sp.]|uniref:hypothetical protein n=1 Tax=uncultured Clostridium sp. TaxID=59620 RepID=UPI00258D5DDE|nr:hypothetical protein [uncultured Clostridium sp.]
MILNNENFNIGDWIEITIYDCMSCSAVITNVYNNKFKLYIKQITAFCYPNQYLLIREIEVDFSEICEIVNVTSKVRDLLALHNSKRSVIELLKNFKGNYCMIKRYLTK